MRRFPGSSWPQAIGGTFPTRCRPSSTWEDYRRRGNSKALETLLAYNIQDVVNLETLLVMAYNLNLCQTPFAASHELPLPVAPKLPFQADRKTIERLMYRQASSYV